MKKSMRLQSLCIAVSVLLTSFSAHAETNQIIESVNSSDSYFSAADESSWAQYCEQTMEQYSFQYEDTGMISDEQFFGKYDRDLQQWTVESYLDYERVSQLEPVMEAAQRGDYYGAKSELLNYYRDKFKNHSFSSASTVSNLAKLKARLAFENIDAYTETPLAISKIGAEEKYYQIDVKDGISVSDINSNVNFAIATIKKDGRAVIFNSKEAEENKPKLTVVVNGRTRTYTPSDDAMVIGGLNSESNYGEYDTLSAYESYSSIKFGDRTDDNTKRIYLRFNLSDISPTDSITSAHLSLYGASVQSDEEGAPALNKNFSDIVVYSMGVFEWSEDNCTFSSVEELPSSYDGEEWMDGLADTEIRNVLSSMIPACEATGDDIYAFHIMRVWLDRINHKTLTETDKHSLTSGMYLYQTKPYLIKMLYSDYMRPEYLTILLKYDYMMMEWCINSWDETHELNNFGTSNCVGVFCTSLTFNEYRICDDPILDAPPTNGKKGGWIEVGKWRAWYCYYKDLMPDGSSSEVSLNYTLFLSNMAQMIISYAQSLNVDLTQYLDEETINQMKGYCLYMLRYSNPQFGTWQQGHEAAYTTKMTNCLSILSLVDDPQLRYLSTERNEGTSPDKKSYIWDQTKRVVLRSDWSENAVAAQTNANGGHLKSHGQNDDLGLNIYAYGQALLMESTHKDYNYRTPVTGWLLSSKAINAVEINNVTQKGAYATDVEALGEHIVAESGGTPGSVHEDISELNDMYNYVRVETEGYKNHSMLSDDYIMYRDILFVEPEFFIVTDYIEPTKDKISTNIYKQYWHSQPNANITMIGDSFRTNFNNSANIYVAPVTQKDKIKSNVLDGYWAVGSSYTFADYVRYDKEAKGTVTFNTVLYPMRAQDNYSVQTTPLSLNVSEDKANAFEFYTTDQKNGQVDKTAYYILFDTTMQGERTFGDYSTDGTLALVDKNDLNYKKAILRNGTNVTDTKKKLPIVFSNSTISDIGITWEGDEVRLDTSKDTSKKDFIDGDRSDNMALEGECRSSETLGDDIANNAIDGDVSTCWTSAYTQTHPSPREFAYLTIDLHEKKDFSKIKIIENTNDVYYLYSSDNAVDWEYIGMTGSTVDADGRYITELEFPRENARYIKILTSEAGDPQICEVEIYKSNSKSVILDEMTVYTGSKPGRVLLNNEEISFNFKNGYIYFGKDQIVDGITSNPDDDINNGNSGSNSGHGNGGSSGGTFGGGGIVNSVVNEEKVRVDYNTVGGSTILSHTINKGTTVNAPNTPFKENYIFEGWYSDLECTQKYSFDSAVNNNVTLYAKWILSQWSNPFLDVSDNDWFCTDVKFVNENKLFTGVSDTEFEPKSIMTRAMAVTVLHRIAGSREMGDNPFTDVESGAWYESAVRWAAATGVVSGISEKEYAPDAQITRQELVTMLYRFAALQGKDVTQKGDISSFADVNSIADWAKDAVKWAVGNEIIVGEGNNIMPQNGAQRAQTAAILKRYCLK